MSLAVGRLVALQGERVVASSIVILPFAEVAAVQRFEREKYQSCSSEPEKDLRRARRCDGPSYGER